MRSLFRRIQRRRPIRFQATMLLSYLVLCTLPIAVMVGILFHQNKQQTEHAARQFANMLSIQTAASINTYISQVHNSSLVIYSDYDLLDYLGREADYSPSERIHQNLQIYRQLSMLMTQLPNLQGVTILSESGLIYSNGFLPGMKAQEAFWNGWLQQIREAGGQLIVTPSHSQLYMTTGTVMDVFTAGRLIQDIEGRHSGILLVHMSPHGIVASEESLKLAGDPYRNRTVIATPEGQLVYDSYTSSTDALLSRMLPRLAEHEWLVATDHSGVFEVTVAIPREDLNRQISKLRLVALWIAGGELVAVVLFSVLLSYRLSSPIKRLIRSMRHIEGGRYEAIPESGMILELGLLTRQYNMMIERIRHLIEDVYKAQHKQNEARLLALQNQINPHWLYNTLESIRMSAFLAKAPDVAVMIKLLGRLFRLALNKQSVTSLVADELEYIRVYIQLQNIRYEHRFRLIERIDEKVLSTPFIRMTLQPCIENSIVHGFVDPDRLYTIVIEGVTDGADALIRIRDDGIGMEPPALRQLQHSLMEPASDQRRTERSSLGLRNIQERLKLHYGPGYGLAIDSPAGGGTMVTLRFPLPPSHAKE